MARTQKEYEVIRAAEHAMDSDDLDAVKSSLFELLNIYQKLSRRVDKILKQSDKQQEALINLNDELCNIRDKQANNISEMIADQKKRAGNILESKKRLYELHKKEVVQYESNINELTALLIEKNDLEKRYALLEKEFKELKSSTGTVQKEGGSYSRFELNEALEALKSAGLENAILTLTKKIFESEIITGGMDNLRFFKSFFKMLNLSVQKNFLQKQQLNMPIEIVSMHIIKSYVEDILCVLADTVIDKASQKDRNAWNFLYYFNGEVSLDKNGDKFKRPEIVDKSSNRWTPASISQIYLQKNSLLAQIQKRKEILKNLSAKIVTAAVDEDEMGALNETGELQHTAQEVDIRKRERLAAFSAANDNSAILKEEEGTTARMIAMERSKILILEESLAPLEEKYDAILSALIKAMLHLVGK